MRSYHVLNLSVQFDTEGELFQSARAIEEVARLRGGSIQNKNLSSSYYAEGVNAGPVVQPAASTSTTGTADTGAAAGGESGEAATTGAASTRGKRRKPAAAADVVAEAASPPPPPPSDKPAAAAEPDYGAASDAAEELAFDGDDAAGATATWPEVVDVLNKLHAKGFDKAKKVLADCGVVRAADLKAEDQGAKRGEVFRAATKALAAS